MGSRFSTTSIGADADADYFLVILKTVKYRTQSISRLQKIYKLNYCCFNICMIGQSESDCYFHSDC